MTLAPINWTDEGIVKDRSVRAGLLREAKEYAFAPRRCPLPFSTHCGSLAVETPVACFAISYPCRSDRLSRIQMVHLELATRKSWRDATMADLDLGAALRDGVLAVAPPVSPARDALRRIAHLRFVKYLSNRRDAVPRLWGNRNLEDVESTPVAPFDPAGVR